VAYRLRSYTRFVIDCGGDIAVGGVGAQLEPYEIAVAHSISGESIGVVRLATGGVATSGLNVRIWRNRDGSFGHHLLDPSTGRPAWTGLVSATAIGDSALEAETLSKMALLLGPERARQVLAEHGGVITHDNGNVEAIGPIDGRIDGKQMQRMVA
jgi:thiamine biosynthesis lipoprotein